MANRLLISASVISLLVVIITLAIYFTQHTVVNDDLIVSLPNGKVKGALYQTPNNISYYGFRGIPFAIPPVGELRFESPQPAVPWSGIWDATRDGKGCVSDKYLTAPEDESEDCLYINVYTPNLKPQQNLTVMVWIYGGAFRNGKADKSLYGPDYLIEEDVLIVSLNYRVGPLSFLSTKDEVLPGNLGLKDQVLALKWVQHNIVYFGGDPEKVTIFGQSAGGTSTGLQLISKQSTGLFRAAIVQSGSGTVHWAVDKDSKATAYLIADGIPGGNYGNDTVALKKFLKERSVQEIETSALDLLHRTVNQFLPEGIQAFPTIEVETENAFLTESPYELLESGNFNKVPVMIGICADESLRFFKDLNNLQEIAALYENERERVLPFDLFPNSTYVEEAIQVIRDTYLGNKTFSFENNLVEFLNYFSDNQFTRGIIKHGELASAYVPVFMYEFSYYGGRAKSNPFLEGAEKAAHGAEVPYIFNQEAYNNRTDPDDMLTESRIVKLWTNFAKYLNPTPKKSSLFDNVIWTRFNNQSYPYFSFNKTLEMRSNIRESNYPMWNQVYDKYGRKPIITF